MDMTLIKNACVKFTHAQLLVHTVNQQSLSTVVSMHEYNAVYGFALIRPIAVCLVIDRISAKCFA
jgi:hypothetical protein